MFSPLFLDELNRLPRMGIEGIDLSVEMRGETRNALEREKAGSDERLNKVRITEEKGWKRMRTLSNVSRTCNRRACLFLYVVDQIVSLGDLTNI